MDDPLRLHLEYVRAVINNFDRPTNVPEEDWQTMLKMEQGSEEEGMPRQLKVALELIPRNDSPPNPNLLPSQHAIITHLERHLIAFRLIQHQALSGRIVFGFPKGVSSSCLKTAIVDFFCKNRDEDPKSWLAHFAPIRLILEKACSENNIPIPPMGEMTAEVIDIPNDPAANLFWAAEQVLAAASAATNSRRPTLGDNGDTPPPINPDVEPRLQVQEEAAPAQFNHEGIEADLHLDVPNRPPPSPPPRRQKKIPMAVPEFQPVFQIKDDDVGRLEHKVQRHLNPIDLPPRRCMSPPAYLLSSRSTAPTVVNSTAAAPIGDVPRVTVPAVIVPAVAAPTIAAPMVPASPVPAPIDRAPITANPLVTAPIVTVPAVAVSPPPMNLDDVMESDAAGAKDLMDSFDGPQDGDNEDMMAGVPDTASNVDNGPVVVHDIVEEPIALDDSRVPGNHTDVHEGIAAAGRGVQTRTRIMERQLRELTKINKEAVKKPVCNKDSSEFETIKNNATEYCGQAAIYTNDIIDHIPTELHKHVLVKGLPYTQYPQVVSRRAPLARELYAEWNKMTNKVSPSISRKQWKHWNNTGSREVERWNRLSLLLNQEKKRQVELGFVVLEPARAKNPMMDVEQDVEMEADPNDDTVAEASRPINPPSRNKQLKQGRRDFRRAREAAKMMRVVLEDSTDFKKRMKDAQEHCKDAAIYENEYFKKNPLAFLKHIINPDEDYPQLPHKVPGKVDPLYLFTAWNKKLRKPERIVHPRSQWNTWKKADSAEYRTWMALALELQNEKVVQMKMGLVIAKESKADQEAEAFGGDEASAAGLSASVETKQSDDAPGSSEKRAKKRRAAEALERHANTEDDEEQVVAPILPLPPIDVAEPSQKRAKKGQIQKASSDVGPVDTQDAHEQDAAPIVQAAPAEDGQRGAPPAAPTSTAPRRAQNAHNRASTAPAGTTQRARRQPTELHVAHLRSNRGGRRGGQDEPDDSRRPARSCPKVNYADYSLEDEMEED